MAYAYPFSVFQNSVLNFVNVIFSMKKCDRLENLGYFKVYTSLTHIFFEM